MVITEQTPVADIAAALPSSVRVFEEKGVDFCCGGKKPIGVVCAEHGLSFDELAAAIDQSARTTPSDQRDWTGAPLHELIDHVIRTYHDPLRAGLPRLQAIAGKVAQVHGSRDGHLARVEEIVDELHDDLLAHIDKEEMVAFPAVRALEHGDRDAAADVALFVEALEQEHDGAGELLAELRRLTGGYAQPEWSCNTFSTLYRELQDLETSLHVHVHLENNILFPRALRQAAA